MATRATTANKIQSPILKNLDELQLLGQRLRRQKKRVVFTNGCFDILHAGHAAILQKARSFGDILVLGVNSDSSIKQIKGSGRPVVTLKYRLALLSALKPVDYLIPFNEPTPIKLIETLRPDILVKGADWKASAMIGREFAKKIKRVRLIPGLSTTAIINRILNLNLNGPAAS